jgi:acylphosphatase
VASTGTVRSREPLANKILLVSAGRSCWIRGAGRFTFFMTEVHHVTACFSGRVQGVGFRYLTLQIAKEFEVAGFVKNLADGRVLLEAEGTAGEVRDFIAAVQERMTGYIRQVEQTEARRVPQFQGFSIR